MPAVSIVFHSILIADRRAPVVDDDFVPTRVRFTLRFPTHSIADMTATVKERAASRVESEPVEVDLPRTSLDTAGVDALRRCVVNYYRRCIGREGRVVRTGPKCRGAHLEQVEAAVVWYSSFEANLTSHGTSRPSSGAYVPSAPVSDYFDIPAPTESVRITPVRD